MKPSTPSTIDPVPSAVSLSEPADDPAFLGAVQEYLALLEAGKAPDRREYARRFPEVADALDKCLAGLEAVHGAAAPKARKAAGAAIDPQLSKPLGDFQIHREIGRGGMGVVYEATQLSLGRKVALKVLPFAATFDAKHLQRFRNEAQAAAQLHHTNIVPVFAVGCERGVHFYAMQLIEGQSLSVLIDQFRDRAGLRRRGHAAGNQQSTATMQAPPASLSRIAAESSEPEPVASSMPATIHSVALSSQHSTSRKDYFRSTARLFVQAALGLDYAHQVGIVHRDIKPANLLVDGRGNLWIADFGLAQFRSETHLTKTGDLVGTLRYMSPEQASGQRAVFDHRCDVYSLGATLYEMATLEPIFDEQDSIALLRKITNNEPVAPRTVDPAIPIELETIILKAVSKTPSERYATAQEMAADLQRYLDDQPILARRPSSVDRLRKWSRRHPAVVAAAVGFLIFCLVGLAANNWLLSREEEKTRKALDGEKKRSEEAERRFAQARQSVELLINVAEQEFAANPQLQAARKKVLQTALGFYKDLIDQRGDDAESQAALERDRDRVRQILSDLTIYEGAQRLELLAEKSVQDDLKFSDEDRDRAQRFAKKLSDDRLDIFTNEKMRSLPFDQQQQRLVALIRENEMELGDLLSAAQLQRLRQIDLQSKGVFAFEDQEVVVALKLDAAQRGKVRETLFSVFMFDDGFKKKFGKGFDKEPDRMFDKNVEKPPFGSKGPKGGKGPPGFGHFRGNEEAHRNGVKSIVTTVLTDEQRALWNDIIGEPFIGSIRSPSFGPPPKDGPRKLGGG